jgi:putative PEP-CTERM system TPR-repeat lipoprotein
MKFLILLFIAIVAAGADPARADETDAWKHLDQAQTFLDQHQPRAAVIELKNAAQAAPANADIRKRLGAIQLQMGNPRAAVKELQQARALGDDGIDTVTRLAEALIKAQQPFEAIELIGTVRKPSPRLLVLRADARLQASDLDGVQADYEAALAVQPTLLPALLGRARLAATQGADDEAIVWAGRAVTARPDSADAWALLAGAEAGRRRPTAALTAYQQALRLDPGSVGLHLKTAATLMVLKQLDRASVELDEARLLAPKNPLLLSLSAMLALQRGHPAEARDGLQRIVTAYPDYYPAQLYLGKAHLALRDYEQAIEILMRYTRHQPESVEAKLIYARALAESGAHAEAEQVLAPVAGRMPDNQQVLDVQRSIAVSRGDKARIAAIDGRLASQRVGQQKLRGAVEQLTQGDNAAALSSLDQLLNDDPSEYRARLLQFRELMLNRDFGAAATVARQLDQLLPDQALPPLLLGIALAGRGDTQAAQAELDRAWRRSPGSPTVATRLAALAFARGDSAAAEAYYREVLTQHPGHGATLVRLAVLAGKSGDKAQRLAWLQQAISYHPLELKPRLLVARALYTNGQRQQAIEVLETVAGIHGDNPSYLSVLAALQMADFDTDAGETGSAGGASAAVVTASRLVKLKPESARGQLILAEARARQSGADAKPYRLMQSAVVLDATGGLIGLRLKPEQWEQALSSSRELQRQFPDTGIWVEIEAKILAARGDTEGAQAVMQAWQGRHPEATQAQILAAGLALKNQDHATAVAEYRKVLDRAPDNITALNNLAWLIRETDPQQALKLAHRAATLSPTAEILDTYGVILMANEQPGRAATVLRKAVARNPQSVDKHLHLAQALAAAGDQKTAARVLEPLLKSKQGFSGRERIEAFLKTLDEPTRRTADSPQ